MLLTALLTGKGLPTTPREAHAQLDQIKAGVRPRGAHETLSKLISDGMPPYNALAIVSDALKHQCTATQVRQLSVSMREHLRQGVPSGYVAGMADYVIRAGYSIAETHKIFNAFRRKVQDGVPVNQAYAELAPFVWAVF